MSEIHFEVASPFQPPKLASEIPLGTVAAIEHGSQRAQNRRWGAPIIRLTVELDHEVGRNIFDYFEEKFTNQAGPRNCLSFAEAAQGRPYDYNRLYIKPDIIPKKDSFEPVADFNEMKPGASYGFLSDGMLHHAAVSLLPDLGIHVEVYGKNGYMHIARTDETMRQYGSDQIVKLTDTYI